MIKFLIDKKPLRYLAYKNTMKILTNVQETRVAKIWQQRTDFFPVDAGNPGILTNIVSALKMIKRSLSYDIVILATSQAASLYIIFHSILPLNLPKVIMIDCLWYHEKNQFKFLLKKIFFRLQRNAVSKYVVWSSHEIEDYSTCYNIPKEKFLFIPFHHTLEGYDFTVSEGDYIWSGGDGDRDYKTLLRAVKEIDVKVCISTRLPNLAEKNKNPNVIIAPTTPEGFRKMMAESKLVVVPMQKGLLHSGGQQTYLNAMAMGKPTIVVGEKGAIDYIENGVNGVLVDFEDDEMLKNAILKALKDKKYYRKLSDNAKKAYDKFSTTLCLERILGLAEEIVYK